MHPDDGIGDQLTRAVVGDLAAALDPLDLDASSLELLGRRQDVRRVGVLAEGQDCRVFEQQQLVADAGVGSVIDEPLLERVRLAVVDATEPPRAQRRHAFGGRAQRGTRIDEGGLHARTIAGVRPDPGGPSG